jgi:hypothetical protein
MDQWTRSIVGFGVHRGVGDGVALCQMFNRAIRRHPPRRISARTMIRCTDSTNGKRI